MEGARSQEEARVSCPVCLLELPAASINSHLDRCLQVKEGEDTDDLTTERGDSRGSPEATGMGPPPQQQPCNKKMRLAKFPEGSHGEEEPGSSLNPAPVFSLFHKGRNSGGEKAAATTPRGPAASPSRGNGEAKQLGGETLAAGANASVPELSGESLAQKLEGKPLADKLRPSHLADYMGQNQVLGEQTLLRSLLEAHEVPSLILWGPPGCGKTTLAHIIASSSRKKGTRFVTLSATSAKTNDVRDVIAQAQNEKRLCKRKTILFIDEIHRFNKSQQDTFLPHVECGTVTLIGATTENPSFQVNSALLSRCRVIVLEKLSVEAMEAILMRAIKSLEIQILSRDEGHAASVNGSDSKSSESCVHIERKAINTLAYLCDGDARTGLNGLQMAVQARLTKLPQQSNTANGMVITEDHVKEGLQRSHILYDRADPCTCSSNRREECEEAVLLRKMKLMSGDWQQTYCELQAIVSKGTTFKRIRILISMLRTAHTKQGAMAMCTNTLPKIILARSGPFVTSCWPGEEHYNCISALHKSMRGSDENASLYWLARMLEGGEDPLYVARRLVRFASEDIGLADPLALPQAVAAYQGCHFIGMPECEVLLAQCVIYFARAPKSIEVYSAYSKVKACLRNHQGPLPPVPLHLRNAPTRLMKDIGYGKGYKYNPMYKEPVQQDYLPEELKGITFFPKRT